ncbi:MAG TPA: sigma 54-interacting transcriptional regulator, partial [Planctomycetota bacterium]|nr:sigma 54-interacting transcriptional regulator [Planctomycetota bacterium]
GATRDSSGYARRAAGGTLILDRVDELSADDQRFLIPVVEGRVRAVGSAVEEKIDCRIIATCRDAARVIPELRQRLAGAVLVLPPLRDRAEDLPSIIRTHLPAGTRITLDAVAELASQPWPGNRPELESTLERLLAQAKDGPIGVKLVRDLLRPTPADAHDVERRRLAALASFVQ